MKFVVFFLVAILATLTQAHPLASGNVQIKKKNLQFDYNSEKIRGVNLGGWFVLEAFITPSIFDIWCEPSDDSQVPVDEYHYTQKLGKSVAYQRLSTHWDTWITENDIKKISKLGLNFVRIPIGYWAFVLKDDDPYVQGQTKYLDRALGWAKKYNLKVWIDLHGAAGSQNGFDNSGLRDSLQFQNGDNTDVTLQALKKIATTYATSAWEDVVIGIELLNEPLGPSLDLDKLKSYLSQGYEYVRNVGDQAVIVQDAFQPSGYWNDFLTVSNGDNWNVVVDKHRYQVFSAGELQRSIDDHISNACSWGRSDQQESHWTVTGEWSAALTDCARWLNGVGRGARWSGDYDNSPYIGSCADYTDLGNWSDEFKANTRKYIEAQLDAFDLTGGWIFWNWKTESAVEWDFSRLIAAGLFPQPFDDRQYPNQCGF